MKLKSSNIQVEKELSPNWSPHYLRRDSSASRGILTGTMLPWVMTERPEEYTYTIRISGKPTPHDIIVLIFYLVREFIKKVPQQEDEEFLETWFKALPKL